MIEFQFTAHIRGQGEEAKAIKNEAGFRARRWVVERLHSWMNRFRGILCAGQRNRRIIWPSSTWPWRSSPGGRVAYWDRLQARGARYADDGEGEGYGYGHGYGRHPRAMALGESA
ncbi:MAG: hypothetical protein HYV63_23140 [Candidatus Schekmanbacteria bacterium]|nr:hypothetical protein [Candidatus Schekmanbacteria bacterium]